MSGQSNGWTPKSKDVINTIVTGASGFIGAHLLKRIDGAKALKHWDIRYGHSYDADRCFFLSTYGNMAHHTKHGVTVKANVQDLITLLNGFRGDWFCYMSSSSVTLTVQTSYSRTKRAGEEILQALPELKSCIARPYSVIGVNEQKEHLIPTLIRSCMEGEEMPFDPEPVHDFIDVSDVVTALIKLADEQATGIYELGNGIPVTNQQVKETVEWICGKKANIKSAEKLRQYDTSAWYCQKPSIKGAKTLVQSIQEMVEAYKDEHGFSN